MKLITNDYLRIVASESTNGPAEVSSDLLPLRRILAIPQISLRLYAIALVRTGLTDPAFAELKELKAVTSESFVVRARAALLEWFLTIVITGAADSLDKRKALLTGIDVGRTFGDRDLDASRPRPSRLEIVGPYCIHLAMASVSSLAVCGQFLDGKAISLCTRLQDYPPIRCASEKTADPEVVFRWPNGSFEIIRSWDDLHRDNIRGLGQACISAVMRSLDRRLSFSEVLRAHMGGGVQLSVPNALPSRLYSGSTLISIVLQSLLRYCGRPLTWQDVLQRVIEVEQLVGISGVLGDVLPGFWGGVVQADTISTQEPALVAHRLNLPQSHLQSMSQRIVLYDTGQRGQRDDMLLESALRYLEGDEVTLAASNDLANIASLVSNAVSVGDWDQYGKLATLQWETWKVITAGVCTNAEVDHLVHAASRWTTGAKINGFGHGDPILFVTKEGMKDKLCRYLNTLDGRVLVWKVDNNGYEPREWHEPRTCKVFVQQALPKLIGEKVSFPRHGEFVQCEMEVLGRETDSDQLVGPMHPAVFDLLEDLALTVNTTAASVMDAVGTANDKTLHSVKRLVDATASEVFASEIGYWKPSAAVGSSEGKDEHGGATPTVISNNEEPGQSFELRSAVDVVDGTTLAAMGLEGAYCICTVAEGLRSFPELQAYAILAPCSVLDHLDLDSRPEDAVLANLSLIASALEKQVDELVVVTHSSDTGDHHRSLIDRMEKAGVTVIVPHPVIVEPPYAIAACIGFPVSVDAMIGVYGLTEIVINTVLCGALRGGREFVFRLASNAPLALSEQSTLDGIFDFKASELEGIQKCGLNPSERYKFSNITTGLGCMVAAASITRDPILKHDGVTREGQTIVVNGWLADPVGNLHTTSMRLRRPSEIDYSARFPLNLFDISLLVELDEIAEATPLLADAKALSSDLYGLSPSIRFQTIEQSSLTSGLHVTLHEYIVDYVSSVPRDAQERAFEKALALTYEIYRPIENATLSLGKARRTSKGILIDVYPSDSLLKFLDELVAAIAAQEEFMTHRLKDFHITLARFTEVLPDDLLRKVDGLVGSFNTAMIPDTLPINILHLKRATRTPFQHIQQDAKIYCME